MTMLGQAPFDGVMVASNFLRMSLVFVGFVLAGASARFAWLAWRRRGQRFRAAGLLSYAFTVAAPALGAVARFDESINWWWVVPYILGLNFGMIALWANYTIAPTWWRYTTPRHAERDDRE